MYLIHELEKLNCLQLNYTSYNHSVLTCVKLPAMKNIYTVHQCTGNALLDRLLTASLRAFLLIDRR